MALAVPTDALKGGPPGADLTGIDAHLGALRETVANENEDLKAAAVEGSAFRRPLELPPVARG